MPSYAAVLREVRRCIRAEREAEFAVQALIGWYDHDDEDRALAEAKKATDAAIRELGRALAAGPQPEEMGHG